MSIALVVITDGRDCVHETIASAAKMLDGPITERYLYDDSGDEFHTAALRSKYGRQGWRVFNHPGGRQGFGGAIRYVWSTLVEVSGAEWIVHLEDDFTFNRTVPLHQMMRVLNTNAELAQVALLRQPWNPEEKAAGGIVQLHPEDYTPRQDGYGNRWLEHSRFFTTNPSLYRMGLVRRGWPDIEHSEGHFGADLVRDGHRFAFWGDGEEWVTHIGHERAGCGY